MKKYILLALILSIFGGNAAFAQTTHAKKRSTPCNTLVTTHHRHHGKAMAKHHVKKPIPRVEETIVVDDHSATAIVSVKNGELYVNDSLVGTVKNPKNEDHRIIINYITPPPPAPVVVETIEHVKTNTYTGEKPEESKPACGCYHHRAPRHCNPCGYMW